MPSDTPAQQPTGWQRAETMPNDVQCAWVRDIEGTEAIAERVRFNRSGWAVRGSRREIYPVQWAPLREYAGHE